MTKPKPRRRIPEREVDLSDQKAAMALIEQRRRDRGLTLLQLEQGCGVSIGAYMAWRRNLRSAGAAGFLMLADYLDYEVTVLDHGDRRPAKAVSAITDAIFDAISASKTRLLDLQLDCGYSTNALCGWRSGRRDPSIFALVVLAQCTGLRISMVAR